MIEMSRTILSFVKKDFLTEASYKLSFILGLLYLFFTILIFFFIDKMFGYKATEHLKVFGAQYFPYVFLSMAFFNYAGSGLSSIASKIRTEQYQGTFEALVLAPLKPFSLILSVSVWNFLYSTFELVLYACLGIFVFKIDFSNINIFSFSLVFILSTINFTAVGIISSCFVILFKRGNPISWVLNPLEGMLGGVYFPVTVLPPFLQIISKFIPITYAIKALELSVYKGAGIYDLRFEILILFLFASALSFLGVLFFQWSIKSALKKGQIANY